MHRSVLPAYDDAAAIVEVDCWHPSCAAMLCSLFLFFISADETIIDLYEILAACWHQASVNICIKHLGMIYCTFFVLVALIFLVFEGFLLSCDHSARQEIGLRHTRMFNAYIRVFLF